MAPPFRADQVGSLIRPQYLLDARSSLQQWLESGQDHGKEADEEAKLQQAAKDAAQKAIAEVVAEQVKRQITPISSGEFERDIFYGGFFEALSGVETQFADWSRFPENFPTNRPFIGMGMPGREVSVATGKIKHVRSAYLDDWLYVRSLLPQDRWKDVKITLPSPSWWHFQLKKGHSFVGDTYASDAEYLHDMALAVKQEIMVLYEHGLRVVQIDDPHFTFLCDQKFLDQLAKDGIDTNTLMDQYIGVHNEVLQGLPSDLTIGTHLCRGNFGSGSFLTTGGYEAIAAKLFRELGYKLFYLEYDSDRAGDFEPLKHLPSDKAVVLGLVTTKNSKLEDLDMLKDKVLHAADVIAKAHGKSQREALDENLAVSPQCGFATGSRSIGVGMSEERQWEKLDLLRRLAQVMWP